MFKFAHEMGALTRDKRVVCALNLLIAMSLVARLLIFWQHVPTLADMIKAFTCGSWPRVLFDMVGEVCRLP